ncbi:FadR/GntR family transcriptional regulator [Deinococcus aquiradiocola]|uniref:GntR family transcriptional regulator n=1 Tax=Deinococcus aquiradiocola TaxID=393059 RepID=A0A917UMR6_9DEIO|nr:FadR/GntR family transcriptional regulator [Deinococcus aquiradiocola]GGJ69217.1 GntR family transcriptional regulator [Deinococcus aquiradiocola]
MTGKPVKAVKIADQVASQLQEWFQSGRLTPGTRLPPERELAAQFGVSRTSVRDALRRLELLGYLDARQGDGTYVRHPGGEAMSQPFRSLVSLVPQNAADLLEFRRLLEPEVAAMAAERLTAPGREALLACVARQRALPDHSPALASEDAQFHDLLAQLAGNTVVLRVLETLRDLLRDVRIIALPAAGSSRTVDDHDRIVQAVLAQDRDGARQAMQAHLDDVSQTYARALSQLRAAAPDPVRST